MVLLCDKQQVPAKSAQSGVDIDAYDSLGGGKMLFQKCMVPGESVLKSFPSKEEPLRVLILPATDSLYEARQPVTADHERGLHQEQVPGRQGFRTEEQIYVGIVQRRTAVLTVGKEVSIEVGVVFVGPAEPGHCKGIQDVNDDQRCFILESRESIQKLKLDGRPGKALDAVNSGGMQKSVTRSGRSEPPDVDAERAA